tara:strand:- start:9309 stop:9518 length:210 start_codon:yes stop_codon:yes gene_type:complete
VIKGGAPFNCENAPAGRGIFCRDHFFCTRMRVHSRVPAQIKTPALETGGGFFVSYFRGLGGFGFGFGFP